MSRLRRMLLTGRIIFITTHVLPRALPITPAEFDIILFAIGHAHENRKFALLGYLMMPTHLHLLLAPTQSDTLSSILREIKITASKRIHAARKTNGSFWQSRSFDRIMRSRAIFEKALLYLHLNPVEANLTDDPAKWRWSSWFAYNSGGTPIIPIDRIDWPITG